MEATHPCDGRRDAERAVAELAERLPEALLPLARMAYNYRWSWISGGPALFRDIDSEVWRIDVGLVPLYLLDTDRDDNHPIDRWMTAERMLREYVDTMYTLPAG